MDQLNRLADLLKELNAIGGRISAVTGRPATIGHTGEFIASQIFDIELEVSAVSKAIDGYFRSGPLVGRSVNIKWYGKQESMLAITPDTLPDYYLVMTGPKAQAMSSRGGIRPWIINHVYLFDAGALVSQLLRRGVQIGVATSVRKNDWEAAEIYPVQRNRAYRLSDGQRQMLRMFGGV